MTVLIDVDYRKKFVQAADRAVEQLMGVKNELDALEKEQGSLTSYQQGLRRELEAAIAPSEEDFSL